MTLTEFLLARIAEDEEVAGRVDASRWNGRIALLDGDLYVHISCPHPARVLAECEAKRRIVEDFEDAEQAVKQYDHDHPTDAYWQEWGNRHALELVVQQLAAVYADHPGYRDEWKP